VIVSLRRGLRQMKEASVPTVQSVEKAEIVEAGIQAAPDMVDGSTEPQEEALVEAIGKKKERKWMEEKKQTEKEKERAKDRGLEKQEDEFMLDTGSYSPMNTCQSMRRRWRRWPRSPPLPLKNSPPDLRWNDWQVDPNLPNTSAQR